MRENIMLVVCVREVTASETVCTFFAILRSGISHITSNCSIKYHQQTNFCVELPINGVRKIPIVKAQVN